MEIADSRKAGIPVNIRILFYCTNAYYIYVFTTVANYLINMCELSDEEIFLINQRFNDLESIFKISVN